MPSGLTNPDESPIFGFLPEPRPLGSVSTEGESRFDNSKRGVCFAELLVLKRSTDKSLSPWAAGLLNPDKSRVLSWEPDPEALRPETTELGLSDSPLSVRER